MGGFDLLHSLWSKCIDLHFLRLQEAKKVDEKGAAVTISRRESMDHALVRNARYADANTSVHTHALAYGTRWVFYDAPAAAGVSSITTVILWPCGRRDSTVPASCPFTAAKPSSPSTLHPHPPLRWLQQIPRLCHLSTWVTSRHPALWA